MVVIIVGGHGGTGKTSQLLGIAEMPDYQPVIWGVLEQKDTRSIRAVAERNEGRFYYDKLYATFPREHRDLDGELDQFMIDPHKTLENVQTWRDRLLSMPNPEDVKMIVLDGIGDIRGLATEDWLWQFNVEMRRREPHGKLREAIGKNDAAAWSEVNSRTKSLIEPLMNFVYENEHVALFMTAQMHDLFVKSERVGEELDLKNWLEYPAETIIMLERDLDKGTGEFHFNLECTKVPLWAGEPFVVKNIPKTYGLLAALTEHGLLPVDENKDSEQ